MAIAAQADNIYGTGGGKARTILADPVIETVVRLIQPHVEPFYNMYDDNADIQVHTDKLLSVTIVDDLENKITEKDEEDKFEMEKESSMTTGHDWSKYNPAMMKAPISAALSQPSHPQPFSQPPSKASKLPPNTNTAVKMQSTGTPDSKNVVSRRRLVLATSASQTLLETKIASFISANVNANKEHELEMEILLLKKKQEEEKLKQEEMKTELLRIQIEQETGIQCVFANDKTD